MFQDANVSPGDEPPASLRGNGLRVIQRYYNGIDWTVPGQVVAVLPVFEHILSSRQDLPARTTLIEHLSRDGYIVDFAGRIRDVLATITDAALGALSDPGAIRDHLDRIATRVESDPRAAVSSAKSLIESTAKLVLRARGQAFGPTDDLPSLVRAAQESLALGAADVDHSSRAGGATKKILGSLSTLTQGLTELRNDVGPDHGRESVPAWVRPRRARLAAGAGRLWCQFVLDTLADPAASWRTATDESGVPGAELRRHISVEPEQPTDATAGTE